MPALFDHSQYVVDDMPGNPYWAHDSPSWHSLALHSCVGDADCASALRRGECIDRNNKTCRTAGQGRAFFRGVSGRD